MWRVNNFNKKKKKSLRRGEQPRRAIRFASKHARPDLRPPFPFVAPKSWRRTVPRCIIRRDDAPRRVPLFVRWNEEFSIAITIISFFPLLISFFQQSEDLAAREQNFSIIVSCDTSLFKRNLYRLVWNGGSIYMYYRFWIDFCSNEKESEPVLLQKIFLIIIIKI